MKKGKFIVFDGIDGAGKTTQLDMLARRMMDDGESVYITAEPTGRDIGRLLRSALSGAEKRSECEMAVMFVLDRIAHNAEIEEKINDGVCVLCDRYYHSTLAYQGKTTDYAWVRSMNIDCPEIRKPDACIYLDLTPEQSLKRISRGRSNVEIYENLEKLTEVRASFHSVIEDLRQNGEKIFIIDADRSREELAEEIYAVIKQL
ncbi:MAG: dTMP kinase [Clostridia bacterium]|jgi:dTMP kinase|nr:dTMP kinase [Clostridia bacterium]